MDWLSWDGQVTWTNYTGRDRVNELVTLGRMGTWTGLTGAERVKRQLVLRRGERTEDRKAKWTSYTGTDSQYGLVPVVM